MAMKRIAQLFSFRAAWRKAMANRTGFSAQRSGWRLCLRRARLASILDQVSAATGLVIDIKAKIDLQSKVAWDEQPVTPENALGRLTQALQSKHCLALQKGRKLMIIHAQDAMKHTVRLPLLTPTAEVTRPALVASILYTDVFELVRTLASSGTLGQPRTNP